MSTLFEGLDPKLVDETIGAFQKRQERLQRQYDLYQRKQDLDNLTKTTDLIAKWQEIRNNLK